MTKKPLIIVDSDEEIKALKAELDEGRKLYETSIEFLKKQQEENWKSMVLVKWNLIEECLKARGLLPADYDDTKHTLGFGDGVLYLTDKEETGDVARQLFNMLFNRD